MRSPRKIAILGAGCAGTLLAAELRRQRFAGHIELLDARADFTREQRWCFWRDRRSAQPPGLCSVDHEWTRWKLKDGRQEVVRSSSHHGYSHVHGPSFFRHQHASLAHDQGVALRFGCRVDDVRMKQGGGYFIETDWGMLTADEVIDARHQGACSYSAALNSTSLLLWQSFLGRVVECALPCFDPGTITLMDFRLSPMAGLTFGYVLPFTATRALVEIAVMAREPVEPAGLTEELDEYLAEHASGGFATVATEHGVLPMTPAIFPARQTGGITSIGVGGGAARPSSAYAFSRMLRSTPGIAAALCHGRPATQPALEPKYRLLDTAFLRLLRDDPAAARRAFMAMFTKVPADRLIRFLTEASSLGDDLLLGWALPKAALLKSLCPFAQTGRVNKRESQPGHFPASAGSR